MSSRTTGIRTRDLLLTRQMRYGVALIHSGANMTFRQLSCTYWQLTLLK